MVIASLIWVLALSPLAFLGRRVQRFFPAFAFMVGLSAAALMAAGAWFGIGITENLTTSLEGSIYVHRQGAPFSKGDLVAYHWHGGATYPAGTIFIKRVFGVPGDHIERRDGAFWVGGKYIGIAKTHSRAGVPLAPAAEGVIPPGEYFVATPSPDSLDSRYALAGNVKQTEVIGRAYALF
jgi:conjugal transfer pilin signal peptidase TrbI